MVKTKKLNVLCTVLFIGVILSCTAYFGITAIMDEQPRDGDAVSKSYGISFAGFSDAFYGNKIIGGIIDRYEYKLFGAVGGGDIIVGKNGFLFDAGTDENGYSYLKDYLGIEQLTGYELEAFASILRQRQLAYKNKGADYLLVVIPNSQAVYSELVPSYIGPVTGATRLDQLTDYLTGNGIKYFLNATDALVAAKEHSAYPLYNNTENSLNSLGEWFVYSAVYHRLSELYSANGALISFDSLNTYVSYTVGKELARRAGLSEVIRNMTVSMSSSGTLRYGSRNIFGSMLITEVSEEHPGGSEISMNLLLEFTDDWDRIQLMPYFSDTYREVTYKSNHHFSSLAVESIRPDIVVQFIHEYELYDIISDYRLNLTYNAGMNLEVTPDTTASPILIAQAHTGDGRVVIAGRTEDDALIKAAGKDITLTSQKAIGSLFFIEVDIGDMPSSVVYISAKVQGKAESSPQPIKIVNDKGAGVGAVAVGSNSQLYSSDYSDYVLLSEEQQNQLAGLLSEKLEEIRFLSGKQTEYIYVIAPDKLSVYPEDIPLSLLSFAGMMKSYRGIAADIRMRAGMEVIDLTEEMTSHKVLGHLYYQTGILWNDLGAFIGYHTLAQKIADRFSGVKVLGLGDFDSVQEENIGGELLNRLGFDRAVISEKYLRQKLNPNYTRQATIEYSGIGAFDITQAFITYNENSTLPVAIVTRDAYGTAMLENMAENFSKMVVMAENDHTIPDGLIAEISPDFIITIRCNGIIS